MGIIFNWFKGYNIVSTNDYHGVSYFLSLTDRHNTEHSARNVIKVQDIFENITGKRIPIIDCNNSFGSSNDAEKYIDSELIDSKEMSNMCCKILLNTEINDSIRMRVERIKELSDIGYYVAYDAAG